MALTCNGQRERQTVAIAIIAIATRVSNQTLNTAAVHNTPASRDPIGWQRPPCNKVRFGA